MKHYLTRKITCTDSFECSDKIVKQLENKFNQKYMKLKETDPTPDGSVSILHTPNNHQITIETNKTKQQIEDTL